MRVSELMSRDVVTLGDTETCHEAIDRMCRRKVRHLPVLDREGALVGIVTDRDVRHRSRRCGASGPQRPSGCGGTRWDAFP